jgi:DNA-binding IclR family transcriptional regulator
MAKNSPASARRSREKDKDGSLGRMLSVLALYTEDNVAWVPEKAAKVLGASRSTVYRYFKILTDSGLLVPQARGSYTLGPAILKMDRLIRRYDPLIQVSHAIMQDIVMRTGALIMIARLYRDTVICIHQEFNSPGLEVAYERGRPMPLFRGATSKVILAHLPSGRMHRLYTSNMAEVSRARMGNTWDKFRAGMRRIRKAGFCMTHDEVNKGFTGIAAPIFGRGGEIEASLSLVFSSSTIHKQDFDALTELVKRSARMITAAIS